jgi:HEAT repeat protein
MSKAAFDRKLAEIELLRSAPEDAALSLLKKALGDRSNYVAGKAASIAGDRLLHALEPDLIAAFERFMRDPSKSDPQCWAKNAIVKALKDLGHADAAIYLRGIEHFQMEPVWGGREDTATTLRATCAHALVSCRLDSLTVLARLTDLLADPAVPVRIDAARAIAQLGAREGSLPLRLKALIGDAEPEVTGHCLIALLNLDPHEHLAFVASFLAKSDPDVRMEAAAALAQSHEPKSMSLLQEFWDTQTDPQVKRTLLTLIAASPLPASALFLRSVAESASTQIAAYAREALSQSRHNQSSTS